MSRRFLLMHTTQASGHHRASLALAEALRRLDGGASVACVDAFRFTSPLIRWAILRSYHSLIRHQPDVWEYLYDNAAVHRQVQHLRGLLHRYHAARLRRVLDDVRPDAIACTQAYPCGMVADFKRQHGLNAPIVGVLTDHAPHLYWFHELVDMYVVPSERVRERFLERGVAASRIRVIGIPVDLAFCQSQDREAAARRYGVSLADPVILLMGGSTGFGALRQILGALDTLPQRCQLVVVAGTNEPLRRWVCGRRFRHRVIALGYVEDIPALMELATVLISKPGGMTISEALAKRVPMVLVNPIPGQEAYNARHLVAEGAALEAGPETVRQTVRDLLESPTRLASLRGRLGELARPMASLETARLLWELAQAHARRAEAGAAAAAAPGP
jgi:processive 1,2-diacylglycerol beta-glucosyltransferase